LERLAPSATVSPVTVYVARVVSGRLPKVKSFATARQLKDSFVPCLLIASGGIIPHFLYPLLPIFHIGIVVGLWPAVKHLILDPIQHRMSLDEIASLGHPSAKRIAVLIDAVKRCHSRRRSPRDS
jgi:hypothetical protein